LTIATRAPAAGKRTHAVAWPHICTRPSTLIVPSLSLLQPWVARSTRATTVPVWVFQRFTVGLRHLDGDIDRVLTRLQVVVLDEPQEVLSLGA